MDRSFLQFALPFVERYRVREFVFTPTQCNNTDPKPILSLEEIPIKPQTCDFGPNKTHSSWNCDGELLYQPSVRVCAQQNLIQILTRSNKEHGTTSARSSVGDVTNDNSQCATISSSVSFTRSPSAVTEEELDVSGIMLQD